MLLSTRTFLATPAASALLAVPVGLTTLIAPTITVLAAPEPTRNARLTLLDAFAELAPTAVGAVALETASLMVSFGGVVWNVGASFGAVTALADVTGLRINNPVTFDVEEFTQAGFGVAGVAVTCLWQAVVNNTGAATTAALARQYSRWRYELSDAKGFG